jgi:hypothetical protein
MCQWHKFGFRISQSVNPSISACKPLRPTLALKTAGDKANHNVAWAASPKWLEP